MRVSRKGGAEEEFVREKIVVAVVKAGGDLQSARAIAQEVEQALSTNEIVTSARIKTEVLNRLRMRNAAVYQSWMDYDTKKGRS